MDFLQVLLLSVVEGITEFLPISSTGHLILTSDLLQITQTEFVKSFEIIIQLGAIMAVVVLYWKTILLNTKLWSKLVVAFLPAAILGFTLYKLIKVFLIGNTAVVLWSLALGGIILIIFEKVYSENGTKKSLDQINIKQAFLIGLFQSISMIPGVSRSASTIVGGLITGLNRQTAVEFSFLLAIPTMAAATGLDLIQSSFAFSTYQYLLLGVGLMGSFLTALMAIKYFLKFIQHHTFIPFGIYRIVLALAFWLVILR